MTTTEKITAGIMAAATALLLIRNGKSINGIGGLLGWYGNVTEDMILPYEYPAWNKGLQTLKRELNFFYAYNPQNGTYAVYYRPQSSNLYILVCVIDGNTVYWGSRVSRYENSYYSKIREAVRLALEMTGESYKYERPTWSPQYMHLFTD